jgi:guanosine-3',5'-bis(diphosphate) 3'-pyrophosphohydrolase
MAVAAKIRFEDILTRMEQQRPDLDEDLLRHAYVFAANRHQGQIRRSGEPYLNHPLTVAWILSDMGLDEETVAAGLLHDLLEDTATTAEELEIEFGAEVARLVMALTKMADFESSYSSREATEAENFRRLLLASVDDLRVILVKLADRLHNMRTLGYLHRDRQVAIARETLEIFAPIANRLGIGSIKTEMEDLCFRYLHPNEAEKIDLEIEERREAADRWFVEIQGVLGELLEQNGIEGSIQGRIKHLYSIFEKLKRQGVDVANVFDFLAFRIIVQTVADCYAALGLIHQQWPPVPGRLKDHIAIPKPNAYQSLHTTVIGPEGHPFEIQIRTYEMNRIAEFGIAAHWSYKEKGSQEPVEDSRVAWLRSLLDNSEGSSPREFIDSLKVDLYPDDVYCFTPRGDVFSFPRGATILDFAYRVHSQVGQTCVGGRINGRWVPLKTELKNGDIVEITTSNRQRPHHDWLNLVATNRARSKIRAWLKHEEKERAVEVGRKLVDRELRKVGTSLKSESGSEELRALITACGHSKEDDLLAAVGFGKLPVTTIVAPFRKDGAVPTEEETKKPTRPAPASRDEHALEVTGDADFLVYLAKCCKPLPGEQIVGFVTRGKGVAVHARGCPNVRNLFYHPEREIEVQWAASAAASRAPTSQVDVDMAFNDSSGMLASISQTISSEGSDILNCRLRTEPNDTGFAAMTIVVHDAAQLTRILNRLQGLKGMLRVERRSQASASP